MSDLTEAGARTQPGATWAPMTIHDTMTGSKRPLELLERGRCRIYCCGPTVYDLSHIGHARAALAPDVLVRFLRSAGVEVKYVRNITDVDDKIIARANESGGTAAEVARIFTDAYHEDMRVLGMLEPDVEPRVTEHIPQTIALVEELVRRGLAYAVDGDVYFRVQAYPAYGRLSKRNPDELRSGARVDVDERKENPLDFALWKAAKPGEPSWPSPWGAGRPGWHIECSAMSEFHLGPVFDVHTGGRDLIFPHHENEVAQSCGAHGEGTYARYWMHNGFVNFAGEKMSKSLGNFFTIREVVELYHPEVLRYFLLSVHYRSPVNFDVEVHCPACDAVLGHDEQDRGACTACGRQASRDDLRLKVRFPGLDEADERVTYVYETLVRAREFLGAGKPPGGEASPRSSVSRAHEGFSSAMQDDLNTAAALAELSEAMSEVNRLLDSGKGVDKAVRWRTIERFVELMTDRRQGVAAVLGVFARDPSEWLRERRELKAARMGLDIGRVEALVGDRQAARARKDWETADRLRNELGSLGVTVRDGPHGSTWTV